MINLVVQELQLEDLTLAKGQVRTKVGEGIDELAESIRGTRLAGAHRRDSLQ